MSQDMQDINLQEEKQEIESQNKGTLKINSFFELKLDSFDGPIDLLLHLVKKNELEIKKVSLAQVANQYFECLEAMRRVDLDIAGEYLVMATTLLSIKSCVLLNKPVELEMNEDGEMVDPHEELLKRLKEAQIYKEGARELSKAKILGVDVFSRASSLKDFEAPEAKLKNYESSVLAMAFAEVLKRIKANEDYTVQVDSVSIVERMMIVLESAKKATNHIVTFDELTKDIHSEIELVGTFCAILELCRRHVIKIFQEDTFGTINVGLSDIDFDEEKFKREYKKETSFENDETVDTAV